MVSVERSDANTAAAEPDFLSALRRSEDRKADADRSLEKVMAIFDNEPAKKRAAKKAKKEIASAFSEV